MNRAISMLLCAAGMALAGSAGAQAYFGAGAGRSKADLDCSGTTSCDRTDTAFKLFGGYMFTPNWGVEGTYYDQGKAKLTAFDPALGTVTGRFKGDGFGVYGVAALPLDKAAVFAKLGVVSAKVRLDATSSTFGGAGTSERHSHAAWGLGASYAWDRSWTGRVEVERVRAEFMDEKVDVDLWTLSAVYRF